MVLSLSPSPSLALCLTAGLWVIFSQLQEIMDEIVLAEEEEKKEECLSSNKIKEMYKMWETVQNLIEKCHLSKAIALQVMNPNETFEIRLQKAAF